MLKKCHFRKNVENQFWPVLKYVKNYAEFESAVHFAWNLQKWHVFDDFHFCIFSYFCIFLPNTRQMAIRTRVGRWGGSRGGSLGSPFLLSQAKGGSAASDPPGTDKQTHRQTRLPSRTPLPIAPRGPNTPLGTLVLINTADSTKKNEKIVDANNKHIVDVKK